ncbi:MAG: hypothetical protein HOP28_15145 [Gemmatimonadales bacterium]|nr:hypothetical protein [Gemmatimonadales bacterium]
MRTILGTAILIAGLAGCTSGSRVGTDPDFRDLAPTTISLRIGQHGTVGSVGITFVRVPEDSRCPADVVCAWAGNAAVELRLEVSGSALPKTFTINSLLEPREHEAFGLRFSLVALTPAPISTQPTDPAAYLAEIRVRGIATSAPLP